MCIRDSYTKRDKKNYGDTDIAKVAFPKFEEKLSVCRLSLIHISIYTDGCAYGISKRKLNKNHLNDLVLWKVRGCFFVWGFLGIELV